MSFGGLYTSISGIYANKKALDTVSHNVSNMNNECYVRQGAIHATNRYSVDKGEKLQIGTGVHVEEIRQIRDKFLDFNFRYQIEKYGYWNATSDILNEVEVIFNEITSSGLQEVMNDFWDSWSELYKRPDSLTDRGLVHESAVAFTQTVNHIDMQLTNLQINLNKQILNEVSEANKILKDIVSLNDKIKVVEGQGPNIGANDYRDMRNDKLDKLAKIIPIDYYEKETNEIVVSLYGRDLINGDYENFLTIEMNEKGYGNIHWLDTKEKINLKGRGELGGYIDARDGYVEGYRKELDRLVKVIADEINKLHIDGKDLREKSGFPFFINYMSNNDMDSANITAANIRVNPELSNFNKIAASKSGAIGDGEIIKDMLALRDETFDDLDDMSFDDFYRELVSDIGVKRQKARSITLNQKAVIKQVDDRRKAISEVSLDEEMADMLKYQHSYIANSRVVNAIDEMVDIVVNKMGVVGR